MAERLRLGPLFELIGRREILVPLAVATLGTYVAQGVISFLPTFLVEFRGYSPAFAGGVFSAFFVVRAGAQVGLGRLSDRLGRDASIAASLLGGALGLGSLVALPDLVRLPVAVGLPALPTTVGLGVAVFLAGLGSSFFSAIDPRFMDALGDAERGAGFGLIRTVYTVIGSAGSVGVGLVADVLGWGASFAVIAGMSGVAFLVISANALVGEAIVGVVVPHAVERGLGPAALAEHALLVADVLRWAVVDLSVVAMALERRLELLGEAATSRVLSFDGDGSVTGQTDVGRVEHVLVVGW